MALVFNSVDLLMINFIVQEGSLRVFVLVGVGWEGMDYGISYF